jgi:predicted restriction endonuclease
VTFLPTQRGAGRPGRVHVNGKWYDYSERVHCSVACKHAGQRIVMTGRRPSSGIYADTYSFRASVRAAFIDRCSLCGWAKAPCDLAHIEARNGDPGKDRLENVTMLCPNHHRMFDKGLIPVEQVRAARDTVLR